MEIVWKKKNKNLKYHCFSLKRAVRLLARSFASAIAAKEHHYCKLRGGSLSSSSQLLLAGYFPSPIAKWRSHRHLLSAVQD